MPQKAGCKATIRLVTAVITFRNKERNVNPVKVNVLDVLRNVKLVIQVT